MKIKTVLKALVLVVSMTFAKAAMAADTPGVHGMLVFGGSTIFFSHLPMFHKPHDYQAVFVVKLSDEAKAIYVADKKAHSEEKVYTFVPEVGVLPDMILQTKNFKGQLYRGHFERGGTLIADNVQVTVQEVVVFKKFDPAARKPSQSSYYLFGQNDEYWLVHNITKKPDFDHVIPVRIVEGGALEVPATLIFTENDNALPLGDEKSVSAVVGSKSLKLETLRSTYTEFGDLSM